MSKPLELTVYEVDDETGRYIDPRGYTYAHEDVEQFGEWKRLTEAELAAEFESARCDFLVMQHTGSVWTPLRETWPMNPVDTGTRVSTLLRFASAPHYCEDAA